jgi:hypothetical protein
MKCGTMHMQQLHLRPHIIKRVMPLVAAEHPGADLTENVVMLENPGNPGYPGNPEINCQWCMK